MVVNFIMYMHQHLMPILNGYKFYYVYASTFNAYLEWLQILLCIHVLIFFFWRRASSYSSIKGPNQPKRGLTD